MSANPRGTRGYPIAADSHAIAPRQISMAFSELLHDRQNIVDIMRSMISVDLEANLFIAPGNNGKIEAGGKHATFEQMFDDAGSSLGVSNHERNNCRFNKSRQKGRIIN